MRPRLGSATVEPPTGRSGGRCQDDTRRPDLNEADQYPHIHTALVPPTITIHLYYHTCRCLAHSNTLGHAMAARSAAAGRQPPFCLLARPMQ